MKAQLMALILTAGLFGGCRATRDVTVTSYHVARGAAVGSYRVTRAVAVGSYRAATAPVHLISGHGDESSQTTAMGSDVAAPGHPVPAAPEVSAQPRKLSEQQQGPPQVASSNTTATTIQSEAPPTKPKAPSTAATQPHFPVAKPVPGRAGLVYNPYDPNGGYIDVSGYPSGKMVKDPDSQKIFIVP
jgi:hypothetical protein